MKEISRDGAILILYRKKIINFSTNAVFNWNLAKKTNKGRGVFNRIL